MFSRLEFVVERDSALPDADLGEQGNPQGPRGGVFDQVPGFEILAQFDAGRNFPLGFGDLGHKLRQNQ